MLSLYFNSRLTSLTPRASSGINFAGIWPTPYHSRFSRKPLSQLEVLKKTLESMKGFKFRLAYINLEIDDDIDETASLDIEDYVNNCIHAEKLILNRKRPSTKSEWEIDTEKFSMMCGKTEPVLVAMNHDYIFIDYDQDAMERVVDKIFGISEVNVSRVPRVFEYAYPGTEMYLDKYYRSAYDTTTASFKRRASSKEVAPIVVTNAQTLRKFASSIKNGHSVYIGRLMDWPGIKHQPFEVDIYRMPREFFRHYDGYGMVTGIQAISDLRNQDISPPEFNAEADVVKVVEFFYQIWVDTYLLFVRDYLRDRWRKRCKLSEIFREAVETTLFYFRKSHLELSEEKISQLPLPPEEIINCITSKIYAHALELITQIYFENIVLERESSFFDKIRRLAGKTRRLFVRFVDRID